MFDVIRVLDSPPAKTVFFYYLRNGPVHRGKATNRIGSKVISLIIKYFFSWRADFLVGDATECRVQ